jgi:hypothetical protein
MRELVRYLNNLQQQVKSQQKGLRRSARRHRKLQQDYSKLVVELTAWRTRAERAEIALAKHGVEVGR